MSTLGLRLAGTFTAASLLFCTAAGLAYATLDAQLLADGAATSTDGLSIGDQAVITSQSGRFSFAGWTIEAESLTALTGYASDSAFIAVADGRAKLGKYTAGPGELLIMPPFGDNPLLTKFDAKRLIDGWDASQKTAMRDAYADFRSVAKKQKWAIFFGRLTPTVLNVAAPGSAQEERERRRIITGKAVTDIRFSGEVSPEKLEKQIADRFAAALAAGDVETVASLLDPIPYGGTSMSDTSGQVRRLMARRLIGQRNWASLINAPDAELSQEGWLVATSGAEPLVISLIGYTDFAYVQSVSLGGR